MADQKALFALQPFILQAKSAGPAKAVDIITRATEAAGCFVFSELLELPAIQQLKGDPEYEKVEIVTTSLKPQLHPQQTSPPCFFFYLPYF